MKTPNIEYPPGSMPIAEGEWESGAQWGFYLGDTLPKNVVYTAAAGVAIRSLNPDAPEAILTMNNDKQRPHRTGNWETPGGHLVPIDSMDMAGPEQTGWRTFIREAKEETGVQLAANALDPAIQPPIAALFGRRIILNPPGSDRPELACMPYYWALVGDKPIIPATDPDKLASGTFFIWGMQRLSKTCMNPFELTIVQHGIDAAFRTRTGKGLYEV